MKFTHEDKTYAIKLYYRHQPIVCGECHRPTGSVLRVNSFAELHELTPLIDDPFERPFSILRIEMGAAWQNPKGVETTYTGIDMVGCPVEVVEKSPDPYNKLIGRTLAVCRLYAAVKLRQSEALAEALWEAFKKSCKQPDEKTMMFLIEYTGKTQQA